MPVLLPGWTEDVKKQIQEHIENLAKQEDATSKEFSKLLRLVGPGFIEYLEDAGPRILADYTNLTDQTATDTIIKALCRIHAQIIQMHLACLPGTLNSLTLMPKFIKESNDALCDMLLRMMAPLHEPQVISVNMKDILEQLVERHEERPDETELPPTAH